jgi:hypothetical protein
LAHRSQRPQHPAQRRFFDRRIDTNPHIAGELDLDRAYRLRPRPHRRRHRNRQELQALPAFDSSLRLSPPMMKQVRVHIVPPRHRRHHRAGRQALLDDAHLLRRRPTPTPLRT